MFGFAKPILDELILDFNQLEGTLTTEFRALTDLTVLDLRSNALSGIFDFVIDGLTQLGKFSFVIRP